MRHLRVGAGLAMGGLALAALPLAAPLYAQAPTSEQALADRLEQIQGQPAAGATEPTRDASTRERELIERLEAVRRDLRSEAATGATPVLGEDEVRGLVAEGLGVDVLSIEAIESEGGPAYAVTVMRPPADDNSAFAVETLLVDGATGGLLSRMPRRPRTATTGAGASSQRSTPEGTGLEIRRRSLR